MLGEKLLGLETYTIFCCGTCAISDFGPHHGELVGSTYHALLDKDSGIIFDGPGTEGMRTAELSKIAVSMKAPPSNIFAYLSFIICVTKNVLLTTKNTLISPLKTAKNAIMTARSHLEWVPGALLGRHGSNGWYQNIDKSMIEIRKKYRRNKNLKIIFVGWSRGSVLAYMIANRLAKDKELSHVPVHIIAIDPVPGPFNFGPEQTQLKDNVKSASIFLAVDDRVPGFVSLIPRCKESTLLQVIKVPGNHFTIVGMEVVSNISNISHLFIPSPDTFAPQVGELMRAVVTRMLHLLGNPIAIHNIKNELKAVDGCVTQELQLSSLPFGLLRYFFSSAERASRFFPFLNKLMDKWVSDYHLDSKGKLKGIKELHYPDLDMNAWKRLDDIIPYVDKIRALIRNLNNNDMLLLSRRNYVKNIINHTEKILTKSIFSVIQNNIEIKKIIKKLDGQYVMLSRVLSQLHRQNKYQLRSKQYIFKYNRPQFLDDKMKNNQKNLHGSLIKLARLSFK